MTSVARKPQDRLEQETTPGVKDVILTAWGREWIISAEAQDDWELVEDLASDESGKAPSALQRLLGTEQYAAVKELARDETTGRVPATRIAEFMRELFGADVPNR